MGHAAQWVHKSVGDTCSPASHLFCPLPQRNKTQARGETLAQSLLTLLLQSPPSQPPLSSPLPLLPLSHACRRAAAASLPQSPTTTHSLLLGVEAIVVFSSVLSRKEHEASLLVRSGMDEVIWDLAGGDQSILDDGDEVWWWEMVGRNNFPFV